MSTEANKATMRRLNDAIAAGRLSELEGHPDLWETRHVIPMLHMVFDDWRNEVPVQLAEGPWVFSYGVMSVRHSGQFAGVAPTGRRLGVEVMSVDRLEDGKVTAHNSASTWYDALPVLGARGFEEWPVRRHDGPIGAPEPADGTSTAGAPMHDLLAALCAGDSRAAERHPGAGELVEQARVLRAAFSGLAYAPVVQLVEGDMAATRGTLSGKHTGDLYGLAPTGQAIAWDVYTLARIKGATIVAQRSIVDWLAALRQLGVFTSPTEAPTLYHRASA